MIHACIYMYSCDFKINNCFIIITKNMFYIHNFYTHNKKIRNSKYRLFNLIFSFHFRYQFAHTNLKIAPPLFAIADTHDL